eukprot:s5338_g7.t1
MPSDGPYQKGDRVFVWHKDESKKKSEGVWVRGIVVSQEGAMVLVEVHRAVLRVNQSKARCDGDPWHDVAIPLKSDDSRSSERSEVREDGTRSSSHDEALERLGDKILDRAISGYCYEHEICYHSLSSGKSDFVEITPHPTGLTACTVHSGLAASEPVERESAWHVILAAEPEHMIIHPIIPDQWPQKTQRAFWHVGAEVCRWQDDRGHFVTIMYSAHSGFWLSQCCRSLKWRNSMTFATFKSKQKQQYGEISFLTNLPEGSLDRLESLEEGYDSEKTFDPRPDVGLDFTDQPVPAPDMPLQPPAGEEEVDHPGYEDPHGDTPVDDEDMPPPQGQHPEPDLDDELDTSGDPPSQPPAGGTQVPVPGGEHDESDLDALMDPDDTGGNPPPGGGPQGPGPGYGPSPDEPPLPMEYHDEAPPPEIPPGAPGAVPHFANPDQVLSPPMPWPAPSSPIVPVPIPPHPHFPIPQSLRPPSPRNVSQTRARGTRLDDQPKAKSRTVGPPVVLLPGQSAGKKDPHVILRVTSRLILSLLLRRLAQLRFLVCL